MNKFEEAFFRHAERRNYEVLHSGYPDFLVYSKRTGVFCVELKDGHDKVRDNQRKCHQILNQAGIPVKVMRRNDFVWYQRNGEAEIDFPKEFYPEPRKTIEMLDQAWRSEKHRICYLQEMNSAMAKYVPPEDLESIRMGAIQYAHNKREVEQEGDLYYG